ncbi:MAG TPA: NAD(P)/FAD-dependent oxidoreductase [Myxococcaceae bacterium]|nr:NAD(P)/FAD-dependent oxidoreductase [Myxococcaceae bacterium]
MSQTRWDVVVIGGGPTGEVAAGECARRGLSVALVESALLGGACSYYACMPSKALLRPVQLLAELRRLPGLRDSAPPVPEAREVFRFRDEAASNYDDSGQKKWARKAGVTVLRGRGRIVGEREVEVVPGQGAPVRHRAVKAVIVATGSRPNVPDIEGLRAADPWTNREGTAASEVPEHLAVIGGGPVGCELSQAWSGLGARVTLLVRGDGLAPSMEPFVNELLLKTFAKQGPDVRLNTEVSRVEKQNGRLSLTLTRGDPLQVDAVLVATGRSPATQHLGLESIGLPGTGPVEVDAQLRAKGVDGDWLYAVGDVNGRAPLTHMGKYQARVAAAVIAGEDTRLAKDAPTPQVLFTEPQVGSVGLTKQQAEEAGLRIRVADVPFSAAAGSSVLGEGIEGQARLIIAEDEEVLVGATFAGPLAGELLHAATIAITGRVPLSTLWHAVPSFPTVSELWLRLLEADRDRART